MRLTQMVFPTSTGYVLLVGVVVIPATMGGGGPLGIG